MEPSSFSDRFWCKELFLRLVKFLKLFQNIATVYMLRRGIFSLLFLHGFLPWVNFLIYLLTGYRTQMWRICCRISHVSQYCRRLWYDPIHDDSSWTNSWWSIPEPSSRLEKRASKHGTHQPVPNHIPKPGISTVAK